MAVDSFSVKQFFGGSDNGPVFASANYSGTQFEHRLASHANVDEIKDKLLYQLMTQSGHDSDRDQGSNDNDLNSVFVDFIVNTAKFHRELDRPTGERQGVNPLVGVLKGAILDIIRDSAKNNQIINNSGLNNDVVDLKQGWNTRNLDTSIQPKKDGSFLNIYARVVTATNDPLNDADVIGVEDKIIEFLINLVMEAQNVKNELNRYQQMSGTDITDATKNSLEKNIRYILQNTIKNSIFSKNTNSRNDTTVDNNHRSINEDFANMVAGLVAREALASGFSTSHVTSPTAVSILRDVYTQWENSSHDDVRKFYRAFMDVIRQDSNGQWEANPMSESDYGSIRDDITFRVNLRKVNRVGNILFGETLPLVEVGTNAYYTSNMGVVSEPVTDAKYLSNLYNSVYKGYNSTHLGGDRQLQVNRNLVKNLLLSHTPTEREQSSHKHSDVSLDDYSFEDISTGTVWHRDQQGLYKKEGNDKVYAKDLLNTLTEDNNCYGSGLKANCGRVMQCLVDGDSKALGTCLEAHKDSDMWAVAEDDIAQMHPSMAVFVLKKFGVKGVHATTSNGTRVVVPMELNRWLERLPEDQRKTIKENEQLCNYIKALIAFLRREPKILNKGLTDDKLGGVPESRPEYIKDLGLSQYREPVERQSSMSFASQLIKNMTPYTAPVLGLHYGDRYNPATNARFGVSMLGGAMTGGSYHLSGVRTSEMSRKMQNRVRDGRVKCAEIHSLTLDNIKSQLSSVGHTLSQADEERINKAISNMSDLESKLGKLHDILSTFIEIGQAFGIDYTKYADMPLKEVDINRIRDRDSLVRYLATNVEDMKSCINNNAQLQANINNELMKNIFAQMLETGSKNDGLVDL